MIKFLGKVKCKWCVKYLEKVRLVRSYEYQKVHYLWAKTAVIHGDEIEHIVSEAKRRKEVMYVVRFLDIIFLHQRLLDVFSTYSYCSACLL